MQELENYVKSNYTIPSAAACAIKYTFTSRETTDKITKRPVMTYTVVMNLTWVDKCGKQLQTDKMILVNDSLSKTSEKNCLTIAPGETTNKFRLAKSEITRMLLDAKQEKIDELKQEQELLRKYLGTNNAIIPNEMKPTIQMSPNVSQCKNKFEM